MTLRFQWLLIFAVLVFPNLNTANSLAANPKPEPTAEQKAKQAQDKKEKIGADIAKMQKALPDAAPVKPAQPRKVMVYTRASGFVHSSISLGAATVAALGEKTGAYKVTKITDDPAVFDNLSEYDAIVLMSTTGDFLQVTKDADAEVIKSSKDKEPERKKALIDFVHSGKGLVGVHAATDAYHGGNKWPEYNELIGGVFLKHPYSKITIKIDDPSSAINAQFKGQEFEFTDEIYVFTPQSFSRDRLRVLLSIDVEKSMLKEKARDDQDYAVAWIQQHGNGRVFYTLLGHREDTFQNPLSLQYFLAGMQYALGDLKADATPSAKITATPAGK